MILKTGKLSGGYIMTGGTLPKTIEAYSRAVRRVSEYFDLLP
jgi:hypothetical protein